MRNITLPAGIGLLAVLLLSTMADAASRIYKVVDENGNVVYTDVAPKERADAEKAEVILSEPNRYERNETPLPAEVQQALEQLAEEEAEVQYTSIGLIAPTDDQAIRSNGGTVTLSAAVAPALAPAHQLRFFVDGSPVGTTPATSMNLDNVDRGTHTAQVIVINESGQPLLQSDVVTFHLLRISQNQLVNPPAPTSDGFRPPPS